MVLNGEKRLECEVYIDGIRLEHVSELKYLGSVLDESGTDGGECSRKVASGRRVAGAIRSLVNARDLQLDYARVLHETLLVPVLIIYDIKTIVYNEKKISRIRAIQMDNPRSLLGIRRMDRIPKVQIRELCGVTKGIDKRIGEGVLRSFSHVERMENGRIAKRVYEGECASSRSVGRPWKRWIYTVKDWVRKRGLDARQAWRMLHYRCE